MASLVENKKAPSIRRLFDVDAWCFLALLVFTAARGIYRESVVAPRLQSEFGFTLDTEYGYDSNQRIKEYVYLKRVKFDGRLHQFGFRRGDVLLSHNVSEFYRALDESTVEEQLIVVGVGDVLDGVDSLQTREIVVNPNGL